MLFDVQIFLYATIITQIIFFLYLNWTSRTIHFNSMPTGECDVKRQKNVLQECWKEHMVDKEE